MSFKKIENTIALAVIIFIGIFLNYKYMNERPIYEHGWAKSDRYALALGFINNNFNLFYPETFVLNKQFPAGDHVENSAFITPSDNGITAVDFPIHDYIVAAIMKLIGDQSISVFRWYTLLYSFIGLFFLFRLARLLTDDFSKSLLVIFVMITAPAFVFFQNSTLPSIPSFANATIGLYLYVLYWKKGEISFFHLSMLFFTLAALNRTTFVVVLIAVLGFEFLRILNKETSFLPKLYSVFPALLLIVVYFLWNSYLRQEYGSLFLSSITIPSSWEHFSSTLLIAYKRWRFLYFSPIHYWMFLVIIISTFGFAIWKKISSKKNNIQTKKELSLWLLLGIWFVGVLLFCIFMYPQFPNHDYYFIDILYLPICFAFMLTLKISPNPNHIAVRVASVGLMIFLLIPMTVQATKKQKVRRPFTSLAPVYNYYEYNNVNLLLKELNIPDTAVFLLPGTYFQNNPLCLMNRKGLPIMHMKYDILERALEEWDYNYISIENSYFSYEFNDYSDLFSRFKKIGDNGKISICTFSDSSLYKTPKEFLEIDKKTIVWQDHFHGDTTFSKHWTRVVLSDTLGDTVGAMPTEKPDGFYYELENPTFFEKTPHAVFISGQFLRTGLGKGMIVALSLEDTKGEQIYYKRYDISHWLTEENCWIEQSCLFTLPKMKIKDHVLYLQFFADEHDPIYYNNVDIQIYPISD